MRDTGCSVSLTVSSEYGVDAQLNYDDFRKDKGMLEYLTTSYLFVMSTLMLHFGLCLQDL